MTDRKRAWALIVASVALLALGATTTKRVYINTTASAPIGLYWRTDRPIETGAWVGVPKEIVEGYDVADRAPVFVKRVAATEGADIRLIDETVTIDGRLVATRLTNIPGKTYVGRLDRGYVFLLNDNELSFDSRYYGPVKSENLFGLVELVTWNRN